MKHYAPFGNKVWIGVVRRRRSPDGNFHQIAAKIQVFQSKIKLQVQGQKVN